MCLEATTVRWCWKLIDRDKHGSPPQPGLEPFWTGLQVPYDEMEDEKETVPDPYDRPDFTAQWPEDMEQEPDLDAVTGLPLAVCAVCGMRTIPEGSAACTCPVCGWEADVFLQDAWEPSDRNHGLSLYEARLNFHTFGWSDPQMLIEGDSKNDAEF